MTSVFLLWKDREVVGVFLSEENATDEMERLENQDPRRQAGLVFITHVYKVEEHSIVDA